ncbi:MAG TPA: hypothetical protein VH724_06260 [Candidatus Angelobacter sp.]|nr:hypothetical protein [Candidatus Angelobacter sp.]
MALGHPKPQPQAENASAEVAIKDAKRNGRFSVALPLDKVASLNHYSEF